MLGLKLYQRNYFTWQLVATLDQIRIYALIRERILRRIDWNNIQQWILIQIVNSIDWNYHSRPCHRNTLSKLWYNFMQVCNTSLSYAIFVISQTICLSMFPKCIYFKSIRTRARKASGILAPYLYGEEVVDGLLAMSNTKEKCPWLLSFNTLRPRQYGRHFADDIFKCIFLNENIWIPIKISMKVVPKGPVNDIPSLVQIMAWRRPGDKPLSEPMMVSLTAHICITRPQWVKIVYAGECFRNDKYLQAQTPKPHASSHYSDVIIGSIASQITSLTIVCSSVYSDANGLHWNSPETGEFPAQRASNAENGSIWWRHHGTRCMYILQEPSSTKYGTLDIFRI